MAQTNLDDERSSLETQAKEPERSSRRSSSKAAHDPDSTNERIGGIYYPDGSVLQRPIDLPKNIRLKTIIFVIIALVIGLAFLYVYFDGIVNAPRREMAAVEDSLSTPQALDLPLLSTLVPLSDDEILATLSASGETLFEKTPVGAGSTFELIKLPKGVNLADAGAMYVTGISKLSPSQAVTLLNGSWELTVNREKGMNMGLHYADFTSGSPENAVQSALQAEGLDTASITDTGVDNSGNVYSSGNLEVDGINYAWKISSIPLSSIYEINGVPDSATYVGIRFTA